MRSQSPRPMSRRGISLTGLLVSAALVAASCGSDESTSSSSEPATTEAATTEPAPTAAEPVATEAPAVTEPSTADTTDSEGELWTGTAPNLTPVDDATAAEWQELTEVLLAGATGTPGVIVAVAHPELGFWSTAVGEAEVGVDPMTLDHHSRIGSITKTMTAVAVLQQVDQGAMSLDDTVAEIIPEIAEEFPPTADLTVEDLLSMTSGLPDYANVPGAATAQAVEDPTKVWTAEELIATALEASEVQPVGTPGYSTTNFTILGLMFEAVTGETIEDGVTRIAQEAGLSQTALLPGDQNEMPDPSTHGYIDEAGVGDLKSLAGVDVVAGTDVTEWSLSWGGAGGGAYSTIEDLLLWASTGSGNTLLSAELGEQRLPTEDDIIPDVGVFYGLGMFSLIPGWIGHTGQAIGWEALEMYNPETGGAVAILTNGTSSLAQFEPIWIEAFDLDS